VAGPLEAKPPGAGVRHSGRTARGQTAGCRRQALRQTGTRALDSGHGGTARPRGTASGRASARHALTRNSRRHHGRSRIRGTKRLLPSCDVSSITERGWSFFNSMLGCNAIGPKSTGYAVAHPAYPIATPLPELAPTLACGCGGAHARARVRRRRSYVSGREEVTRVHGTSETRPVPA
jgi:hypothetical protein